MHRLRDTLARTAAFIGIPWALRDPTDFFETQSVLAGERLRRQQSTRPTPGPKSFGEAIAAHFDLDSLWGRGNRFFTALGTVAGFGYGIAAFVGGAGRGLGGFAATLVKWTAVGALAGTLFQMAIVAAAALGLLWLILMAIGLLLNVLTSL